MEVFPNFVEVGTRVENYLKGEIGDTCVKCFTYFLHQLIIVLENSDLLLDCNLKFIYNTFRWYHVYHRCFLRYKNFGDFYYYKALYELQSDFIKLYVSNNLVYTPKINSLLIRVFDKQNFCFSSCAKCK